MTIYDSNEHHIKTVDAQQYASPPCFTNDIDPGYRDDFDRFDILQFVKILLQAELTSARILLEIRHSAPDSGVARTFDRLARVTVHYCAVLGKLLSAHPASSKPVFVPLPDKRDSSASFREECDLLRRNQSAVVAMLRRSIPTIGDLKVHAELAHMLDAETRNARQCTTIVRQLDK